MTTGQAEGTFIHSTAVVEPGATIGHGTSVWHHSHLRSGAVVGSACTIGKNVYIDGGARIGDRVKVENNVSVYRGVELADEVFVGPSATFTNDFRPRAVGDWQVRPTLVGRGASIGANSTIVCGTEVGAAAMVGAGAVVTAPVRAHELVYGNPARHRGWVCSCGAVVSRALAAPADLRCETCRRSQATPGEPAARAAGVARVVMAKIVLGQAEEDAVLSVMRSGQLASGEWVARLESSFAGIHGCRHAVAVSSGTAALVLALRAHGVGPGDEVITSPFTFVATLNAILEVGATARFADLTDDFTVDPQAVSALVSPRTAAVLPVHLYGLPAAMPEVYATARRHGLAVVEDAAQAVGASVASGPAGSFGTGAFSLYATKNITCGEGGLVTTSDDGIAERLRLLRNHGMRARYDYAVPGYNNRLTDLQAAIAVTQLGRLADVHASRSRHAASLSAGLDGLPGLVLPQAPPGRVHAWHHYTVRLTPGAPLDREQLRKNLDAAGVDAVVYYPRLVHDYPCYHGHPQIVPDETPMASRMSAEVLSLPIHPALTEGELARVVAGVRGAFAQ